MQTLIHPAKQSGRVAAAVVAMIVFGSSWATASAASTSNNVIIFGDSLSDVGNAYAAGNTALVPPNYVTGEYTDGTTTTPRSAISGLWIEQLAASGGWTRPRASSSGGFDYAF